MVRYLVAAACAFALVSGPALAETTAGTKTITVQRSADGMGAHKSVTKRYINRYGKMVTKSKTFHDGFSGSSVSRSKTVTDPMTGTSKTRTETIR